MQAIVSAGTSLLTPSSRSSQRKCKSSNALSPPLSPLHTISPRPSCLQQRKLSLRRGALYACVDGVLGLQAAYFHDRSLAPLLQQEVSAVDSRHLCFPTRYISHVSALCMLNARDRIRAYKFVLHCVIILSVVRLFAPCCVFIKLTLTVFYCVLCIDLFNFG
jgi:hypothetical protein